MQCQLAFTVQCCTGAQSTVKGSVYSVESGGDNGWNTLEDLRLPRRTAYAPVNTRLHTATHSDTATSTLRVDRVETSPLSTLRPARRTRDVARRGGALGCASDPVWHLGSTLNSHVNTPRRPAPDHFTCTCMHKVVPVCIIQVLYVYLSYYAYRYA